MHCGSVYEYEIGTFDVFSETIARELIVSSLTPLFNIVGIAFMDGAVLVPLALICMRDDSCHLSLLPI